MNTLTLLLVCLVPALQQDGWRDTHRVHLRNGNFLDGVLVHATEKDILFRWSPGVLMRIKIGDIKGDVEEIKIRTLNSTPRTVAVRETTPAPDAPLAVNVKPPPRDPNKPLTDIEKFFDKLLAQPDMTFETLAKEVKGLGLEGARAIIAELPNFDQQKTDLSFVALDQMRDLAIERDLRGLLDSKRPDLRAAACTVIGNRASVESMPHIVALLQDPAPPVRTAALMALPHYNDPSVLERIADLAIDPAPDVRARAIRSAEELSGRVQRDNDLAQRWLGLLGRGSAGAVGEVTAALGRLADRAGEDFPAGELRDRLTGMLSDREPGSRAAAAFGLASLKPGEPSVDPILSALESEREPKVVSAICDALAKLRAPKAVEPLIEKLREDSKEIRAAAQRALEKIAGNPDFGADYDKWKEWLDKSKARTP